MPTAAEITWAVEYDADYEIWEVIRNFEPHSSHDTEAEATEAMEEAKRDEEAEGLRETICDLVADLEASDLAKLRLLLKILKQA